MKIMPRLVSNEYNDNNGCDLIPLAITIMIKALRVEMRRTLN